jgi:hypothetical protein
VFIYSQKIKDMSFGKAIDGVMEIARGINLVYPN